MKKQKLTDRVQVGDWMIDSTASGLLHCPITHVNQELRKFDYLAGDVNHTESFDDAWIVLKRNGTWHIGKNYAKMVGANTDKYIPKARIL